MCAKPAAVMLVLVYGFNAAGHSETTQCNLKEIFDKDIGEQLVLLVISLGMFPNLLLPNLLGAFGVPAEANCRLEV